MIIKRYLVRNMNEALTRIRYELGKDAIIISQRKVRKSGFKGLFSGKLIEVTAAIENSSDQIKTVNSKNTDIENEDWQNSLESIKKMMQEDKPVTKNNNKSLLENRIIEHNKNIKNESEQIVKTTHEEKGKTSDVDAVHKEVNELKTLLNKVIENTSKEKIEKRNLLEEELNKLDIDEEFQEEILNLAKEILDEYNDEKEAIKQILKKDIIESTQDLTGRIVLVGPTGVGKTTTIAKLAGRLALIEKKSVGLITVDTYRIGAVEQLKTYAEIMNIPFKVVITIKEMQEAIESMRECDVVLIDTTGRSSKNAMQISELRAFVQKSNPDHVSMVISATTKNKDIKSILQGYSELEYDNVIITKLDETTVYGSLYNIAKRANKPIKFITIGQNVPEDIKVPTKQEMVRFILGEETLC